MLRYSKIVRKKVIIIGTGNLGTTLGLAFAQKNYQVYAYDRDPKKLKAFYKLVPRPRFVTLPFSEVKLVFITTKDDEIKKVYQEILPKLPSNCVVIHCSGALDTSIFKQPSNKKIIPLSLHPIQTFCQPTPKANSFSNIYWGVEAQPETRKIARRIIKELGGQIIFLSSHKKPLYHLLLVFASNYLVTLMACVQTLGQKLKIRPRKLFSIVEPLITQTLWNIKKYGPQKSLTGPIVRGDLLTIKKHLEALKKQSPELLRIYSVLAEVTIKLTTVYPNKALLKILKQYTSSKIS
jgi:predicted short-subunit dehydrogenase-like oxidoreductase (DUF2520 family)